MIISKNPHLTNSLDGSINQPSSRKISNVPFKIQKMYVKNIFDEYDNITMTNCTDMENDIDIIIPTLLLTVAYHFHDWWV